ncbi:MAG: sugar transferase [Cytophagales bacterium]|jgi:lipopolysaccharide/colanic/teichoic acid biosynthesis glycosyltransferase|nr:sugar transferase [Cytophagales bacterium]MCA6383292.1 sugar transferase [Cytophagales bacterium]
MDLNNFNINLIPMNPGKPGKLIIAIFLLVLAFPLLLVACLAVLIIDGWPVFFIQRRHGLHRKIFLMLKLRTFEIKDQADQITWLGTFLRKFSIDELPQLINVIMGDMNIVGPRPHAVEFDREIEGFVPDLYSRYKVKPGITGLAQVFGARGCNTSTNKDIHFRIRLDRLYLKRSGFKLDFYIFLRTVTRSFIERSPSSGILAIISNYFRALPTRQKKVCKMVLPHNKYLSEVESHIT